MWESGQDVSSRFGPQQTGGTIIQHVRPVDLQASMVQSANILARWATLLSQKQPARIETGPPIDFAAEALWWQQIGNEFTVKTRLMWRDGWFRDHDAVTQEWSSQQDTMHFASIFCGAAGREHIAQLREWLVQPPSHSGWNPLSWPPVIMTLVGACSGAKMDQEAAEFAYRFIDASYRSTDSQQKDAEGGLPGITREYRRPVSSGSGNEIDYVNAGIEGYGWGAISIHLLLRYIFGLREEEAGKIAIVPMFPRVLRKPGASYHVGPVQWGKYQLTVTCTIQDQGHYSIHVHCTVPASSRDLVVSPDTLPQLLEQEWTWEGAWGDEQPLQLP